MRIIRSILFIFCLCLIGIIIFFIPVRFWWIENDCSPNYHTTLDLIPCIPTKFLGLKIADQTIFVVSKAKIEYKSPL